LRRTEAPTKLPHSSERLDQSVVTVSVSGCGKYRTTHTSSKRPPSPPNQTRTHTVRKDHIEQLAERIDPYDDELDPPVVRFTEDRSCAKLYHAWVVYSSVERRVVVFHAKADGPTNERSHTRADSRTPCLFSAALSTNAINVTERNPAH
jgi:cob(I)alamin adenosyltransferase